MNNNVGSKDVPALNFTEVGKREEEKITGHTAEKFSRAPSEHLSVRVKILVVDDSKSVRLFLKKELEKIGHQVLVAENGRIALDVIKKTSPDVILSDVYMPEMNGIELCAVLHGDPLFAGIPFVVMSTENDAGNMRQMMKYGAAAFIIKPFSIEQLIITLNNILSYEFTILLKEKERLTGEQELLLAGITSLVRALEAKDQYTRGHSERVSWILAGLVEYSGGRNLRSNAPVLPENFMISGK